MTDFGDLKLGTKFTNSLGQVFVYLPPGTFEMGSPITEGHRSEDEGKNDTHTVELTDGFFMAIHAGDGGARAAHACTSGQRIWSSGRGSLGSDPVLPAQPGIARSGTGGRGSQHTGSRFGQMAAYAPRPPATGMKLYLDDDIAKRALVARLKKHRATTSW